MCKPPFTPANPVFLVFWGSSTLESTYAHIRSLLFIVMHHSPRSHSPRPPCVGGGGDRESAVAGLEPTTPHGVRGVSDSAPNHKTTCPPHLIFFLFIPFINYQRLTVNNLPAPPARPSIEGPRLSSAVLSTAAPVRPRC